MRYVGSSPSAFGEDRKKYVVGSGGVNAGDTVFNVSYDEGKVDAYLNGIRLFPDTDFTKTANGVGSNITLASGVGAGDVLELFGLQGVHAGNGLVEDRFVVGTGSTGSGGSYTNSTTVFPSASNVGDTVSVWRNGVKLVHTTDYTVQPAASTVTLGSAASTADEICIQVVGIVTSANFITTASLLDEDNFSSNSETKPASQQSIKAYVDTADALKANVANTNMTGDATGVNLTLSGNLTVNGSTVTADTTNTVIKDNLIGLNNGVTSNANDAGLIIERGSTGNDALIMWDESEDKWTLGTSTSNASSTGNLNITVGTLVANLEGNVTGTIQTAAQANITSVGTLTSATISGDLTVDTNTLKVDSSGNKVGVGTASPTVALEIKDTGNQETVAGFGANDNGTAFIGVRTAETQNNTAGISFETGTTTPTGVSSSTTLGYMLGKVMNSGGALQGELQFWTNDGDSLAQRMVITEAGKVGIGTTDPKSRLNISDSAGATTFIVTDPTRNAAGEHWYLRNTLGNFYIGQATDSSGAWDSLAARVTVENGGNVGIGTTSPSSRLSIEGSNNTLSEITLKNTAPNPDCHWQITPLYDSDTLAFRSGNNSSAIRLQISAGGDTTVNSGNLIIGTAGKGINFHNYGTGSPASNLLDDYEEGSFSVAHGLIYTTTAYYTKIGNTVFVRGEIKTGTINANASFDFALPFTTSRQAGGIATSYSDRMKHLNLNVTNGTTTCVAEAVQNAVNNHFYYFSLQYETS